MPRLFARDAGATAEVSTALVKVIVFVTVVLSGQVATTTFAQTNAYLKARCAQLASYYDYYAARGSFESDGYRNHTRIRAVIDCERGNYEAGIKAMEALLTRKNMGVPRPDVASSPDGRVPRINTALIPPNLLEQPQQASTPSNDAGAYCTTLSKLYRKTAPPHKTSSVTVPVAMAQCQAGNTADAIPVLEQALKNEGMALAQPPNRTEQRQQSSALSNDAAYCATLSKIYRKTVPEHLIPSVTVPLAMARCQAGNSADGIPVLEQALKNEGMTLPRRTQ